LKKWRFCVGGPIFALRSAAVWELNLNLSFALKLAEIGMIVAATKRDEFEAK